MKKTLAVLLTLLLLCVSAQAEPLAPVSLATSVPDAALAPSPEPTPAVTAVPAESGMIRVLLTYPGKELTEADLRIEGTYSLDGDKDRIFRGISEVKLNIADGKIALAVGGFHMLMRETVTFVRHGTDGGIDINNGGGLYTGDLTVSAEGGVLKFVARVYVEDYVKGVVPYEMSDSFPMEALKAQAVAARTYALRRKNAHPDYDVQDNTYDQVYRGINSSYTNAAAAVDETAGLVGTYKGRLAECYYSASNGGQTDLYVNFQKDGADVGYLDMRDDPYDLANPNSRVKNASVPKQPGLMPIPAELEQMLKEALGEKLTALGYSSEPFGITITEVLSVTPHTPKFAVPSRVFTKLRFCLRVNAIPDTQGFAAAERVEQPLTVDLPYFGGIETALGLSISSMDNELVSIAETNESFVIEARRYGHGLGMSQRGAQYMAGQYGWDCGSILAFYYPGMVFEVRDFADETAPSLEPAQMTTPRPTMAPTPLPTFVPVADLKPGEYYAEVSLANAASTLNLRAEPNVNSQILYLLYSGQPVVVVDDSIEGWCKVQVGSLTGYVSGQYLRILSYYGDLSD